MIGPRKLDQGPSQRKSYGITNACVQWEESIRG